MQIPAFTIRASANFRTSHTAWFTVRHVTLLPHLRNYYARGRRKVPAIRTRFRTCMYAVNSLLFTVTEQFIE